MTYSLRILSLRFDCIRGNGYVGDGKAIAHNVNMYLTLSTYFIGIFRALTEAPCYKLIYPYLALSV